MNRYLTQSISFENASAAREIGLENILNLTERYQHKLLVEHTIVPRELLCKNAQATDFLSLVKPYLSEELISSQNYAEIKNLIDYFSESVTSFFGFESSLNTAENQSDFLFAVSSKRGERDALARLMQQGHFPAFFYKKSEWRQIAKFTNAWANPQSILYDKVLGIWFEFDVEDLVSEAPIPNIFIHPVAIQASASGDISQFQWLLTTALPLLKGRRLSKTIEQKVADAILKLPPEAALFQVGIMLARSQTNVRLVIKRIHPKQIIPYLVSLGWSDDSNDLSVLIDELQNFVTRIVLHIGIGVNIDRKIGIECSFYPDQYNKESRWSDFFTYLKQKGLCLTEKKSAISRFPGVEHDDSDTEFNLNTYMTAVKNSHENYSCALVRYISHVKISYEPQYPLEVKVYSGVRLFGSEQEDQASQMKV